MNKGSPNTLPEIISAHQTMNGGIGIQTGLQSFLCTSGDIHLWFLTAMSRLRTLPPRTHHKVSPPLLLLLSLMGISTLAQGASTSPSKALRNFEEGNYSTARKEYEALALEKPRDTRLHYNAGTAAYKEKNFESATSNFKAATLSEDIDLQQNAFYNLGNSLFKKGEAEPDPKVRAENWQDAIKSYETALKIRKLDPDAEHNLNFVRKKLEDLNKEQNKEDQNKEDKENKDDQQEKKDDQKQDQSKQDQKDQNKDQQKENQDNKEQNKDSEQNQKNKEDNESEKKDSKKDQANDKKDSQQPQEQKDPAQQPKDQQNQQEKKSDPNSQKQQQDGSKDAKSDPTHAVQQGQMSPEQAQQLLDAAKSEERALIFQAPKRNSRRIVKDW